MSALFILLGCSIFIASSFLVAFIWSVSNGQYDDDYTPSIRILFDENAPIDLIENNIPNKNISNKKPITNAN